MINYKKKYTLALITFILLALLGCDQTKPKTQPTTTSKVNVPSETNKSQNQLTDDFKSPITSKEESDNRTKNTDVEVSNEPSINKSNEVKPTEEKKAKINVSSSDRLIKLGDPRRDVIQIMGNPDKLEHIYTSINGEYVFGDEYYYLNSREEFPPSYSRLILYSEGGARDTEKVVGWTNSGVLKVTAGDKIPSAPPFTLGSSKEDVAKAMGTPNIVELSSSWHYKYWSYPGFYANGLSRVTFDSNYKVIGWLNKGYLNVSMGAKVDSAPPINLDSTVQDVVKAMGTPSYLRYSSINNHPDLLQYEESGVFFDIDNKLEGWYNDDGKLKVNLGEKDPNSIGITIGSSMAETIKALGTPKQVQHRRTWTYGHAMIFFDINWKIERIDSYGELIDNNGYFKIDDSKLK